LDREKHGIEDPKCVLKKDFSKTFGGKPQAAHATGNTLTDTSMRCPPEPTITPSTGATSV
jgi:hypothetical protein